MQRHLLGILTKRIAQVRMCVFGESNKYRRITDALSLKDEAKQKERLLNNLLLVRA